MRRREFIAAIGGAGGYAGSLWSWRVGNTDDWAGRNDARSSVAVVRLQIFRDRLGVGIADRRTELLDHLGDLGVPHGGSGERRVHQNVIETVTDGAVAFDLVDARHLLELYRFL